jgi:hypothetical protein
VTRRTGPRNSTRRYAGSYYRFREATRLVTGDGFIVTPDGSRAGLEWRLSSESYVLEMAGFSEVRWGV